MAHIGYLAKELGNYPIETNQEKISKYMNSVIFFLPEITKTPILQYLEQYSREQLPQFIEKINSELDYGRAPRISDEKVLHSEYEQEGENMWKFCSLPTSPQPQATSPQAPTAIRVAP